MTAAVGKRLVVFDYDGTLAHLGVDWDAMRADLTLRARKLGIVSSFRPLWTQMAQVREALGARAVRDLFLVIGEHELKGLARQRPRTDIIAFARRLASGEGIFETSQPRLAVFSANLHDTVTRGLQALGLEEDVSVIVGADDVTQWKPAAQGLLWIMDRMNCTSSETLFIGDSQGDATAASEAGVDFVRV